MNTASTFEEIAQFKKIQAFIDNSVHDVKVLYAFRRHVVAADRIRRFYAWLLRQDLPIEVNRSIRIYEARMQVTYKGSEVIFRSFEHPEDVDRVKGNEFRFVAFDEYELIPEDIREGLEAEVSRYAAIDK